MRFCIRTPKNLYLYKLGVLGTVDLRHHGTQKSGTQGEIAQQLSFQRAADRQRAANCTTRTVPPVSAASLFLGLTYPPPLLHRPTDDK